MKEARESRILAENVKLLTYVTIFYLPLAFCTVSYPNPLNKAVLIVPQSMWAINNMFGTGTRGFVIITSLIALGTYAVVFGLLHPPSRQSLVALMRALPASAFFHNWRFRSNVRKLSPVVVRTLDARQAGEVGEKQEVDTDAAEVLVKEGQKDNRVELQVKGFMARFRGTRSRGKDEGLVRTVV